MKEQKLISMVVKHLMEDDFRNVYIKNNWSIDEITNVMLKTFCIEPQNNGWISVEDRLPEPYLNVLFILEGGKQQDCLIGFRSEQGFNSFEDPGNYCNNVTHWQPLPEPPKTK